MTTLILGLGNIGRDYEDTRHNLGFLVADALAEKLGGSFKTKDDLHADIAEIPTPEAKIVLAKPATFMNLSGEAASLLKDYFDPEKIIAVYDDADLTLGDIRVRTGGGTAGHNGVESLVNHLGDEGFVRVRVGIGRPENPEIPLEAHVLGKWRPEEKEKLPEIIKAAVKEIEKEL